MRVLVISDIHANMAALEAVLDDAGSVDRVIFLGDLVGYGPDPRACIKRVMNLPNLTALVGNHDLAAIGELDMNAFSFLARSAAEWTRLELDEKGDAYLRSLQPSLALENLYLAHASPEDPIWEYLVEPFQGPPNFAAFDGPLCFVGHTHVPRVFEQDCDSRGIRVTTGEDAVELVSGSRWIINPGSVGQPRDGDPRAAYGIWEPDAGQFTFHRVDYPIEKTQAKILAAGLPPQLAYRLSRGA